MTINKKKYSLIKKTAKRQGCMAFGCCCHVSPVKAFTLMELMIVIFIFSVLMLIAIPGFTDWRNEYITSNVAMEIRTALLSAKYTAAKHNADVVTLFQTADDGGAGWVVFFDNIETNGEPDEGEHVVRRGVFPSNVELVKAVFGGNISRVIIKPIGIPANDGRVVVKNRCRDSYRKISFSRAGNIRIVKGGEELLE